MQFGLRSFTMCALLVLFGFVGQVGAGTTMEVIGIFPGDEATMPSAINNLGMIVGWSDSASDTRRAFAWADGEFSEIPLGSSFAEAGDVNDTGLVVGRYQSSGFFHAFLWDGINTFDLSIIGGWAASEAFKVNEAGQVIGKYFPVTGSGSHGFLFDSATWMPYSIDIPTGATSVLPIDINEAGQVVGQVQYSDGSIAAFSWSLTGGMVILPSLGGTYDSAVDVNNIGDIAGTSDGRAVLWTDAGATISDIGDAVPLPNQAALLNDQGDVVFRSWADPDNSQLYFLSSESATAVALGTLGGRYSHYSALDESGNVCGWSDRRNKKYHAFLWAPGSTMSDLSPGNPHVSVATAMNNVGQVVGWMVGKGKYNLPAVIWTTTP